MLKRKKDKINFIFKVGKGMDDLLFDSTEKDIITSLGKPNSIDIDIYEKDIEETKRLHYETFRLMISISKYNGIFEPIRIYPEKLLINNIDLYAINSDEIKKFIKKFHKERNIDFSFQKREENDEIIIECSNIGLTIWYQDNSPIDMCIEKPIEK